MLPIPNSPLLPIDDFGPDRSHLWRFSIIKMQKQNLNIYARKSNLMKKLYITTAILYVLELKTNEKTKN